jgi:hypothetical protein
MISTISWEGIVECCVIKGGMKKGNFLESLQSNLCPKPDARQVVIIDHLNIHKIREVGELIKGTGVRTLRRCGRCRSVLSSSFPEPGSMGWSK